MGTLKHRRIMITNLEYYAMLTVLYNQSVAGLLYKQLLFVQ